jgi:hypothetical protein
MDRPLQDVLKVNCFGCGALDAHGFRIKSSWDGDELPCKWRPEPYHIGYPGFVYGGTIASVVDCHSIKPVPIEGEMELRARVLENAQRGLVVGCRVSHSGIECVNAEVATMRLETGT